MFTAPSQAQCLEVRDASPGRILKEEDAAILHVQKGFGAYATAGSGAASAIVGRNSLEASASDAMGGEGGKKAINAPSSVTRGRFLAAGESS